MEILRWCIYISVSSRLWLCCLMVEWHWDLQQNSQYSLLDFGRVFLFFNFCSLKWPIFKRLWSTLSVLCTINLFYCLNNVIFLNADSTGNCSTSWIEKHIPVTPWDTGRWMVKTCTLSTGWIFYQCIIRIIRIRIIRRQRLHRWSQHSHIFDPSV